jgi:hypothetical protein
MESEETGDTEEKEGISREVRDVGEGEEEDNQTPTMKEIFTKGSWNKRLKSLKTSLSECQGELRGSRIPHLLLPWLSLLLSLLLLSLLLLSLLLLSLLLLTDQGQDCSSESPEQLWAKDPIISRGCKDFEKAFDGNEILFVDWRQVLAKGTDFIWSKR